MSILIKDVDKQTILNTLSVLKDLPKSKLRDSKDGKNYLSNLEDLEKIFSENNDIKVLKEKSLEKYELIENKLSDFADEIPSNPITQVVVKFLYETVKQILIDILLILEKEEN